MIPIASDENFNNAILRALFRRRPSLDFVRVQDAGLRGAADPIILEWAAKEGRVLLTHDVTTMTLHAYDRVREGLPMPGVFEVLRSAPASRVLDDLLLIAECSIPGEWEGQVRYVPLR